MGLLLDINDSNRSFTIHDVESDAPITFLADDAMLDRLGGVQGRILVEYETEGTDLRAIDLSF